MTYHTITLDVPDELYLRLQAQPHPLNEVLLTELTLLFMPEIVSLDELKRFTTAQLWALANRPLPDEVRAGLAQLDDLERHLTPEEELLQEEWMQVYHQYLLMWTKVLIELEQRGEDIQKRRLPDRAF